MSYAFQKDSSLAKDQTVQNLQAVVEQINLSVNQGVVISGVTDVNVTNDFASELTLTQVITVLEDIRNELVDQPDAVVVVSGIDNISVSNLNEVTTKIDEVIAELQSLETSGEVTISGVVSTELINASDLAQESTLQNAVTELQSVVSALSSPISVEVTNVDEPQLVLVSGTVDVSASALEATAQDQLTELQNIVSELQEQPDAVVIVSGTTIIANSIDIANDTWATEATLQTTNLSLANIETDVDTYLPNVDIPISDINNKLDDVITNLQSLDIGGVVVASGVNSQLTAILADLQDLVTSSQNIESDVDLMSTAVISQLDAPISDVINELQTLEVAVSGTVSANVLNPFALESTLQTAVTRLSEIRDELINQPDSVVVVSGIDNVFVDNLGDIETKLDQVITELQALDFSGTATISGIVDTNVLNEFASEATLVSTLDKLEEVRQEIASQETTISLSGTLNVDNVTVNNDFALETTAQGILSELQDIDTNGQSQLTELQGINSKLTAPLLVSGVINVEGVASEATALNQLAELQNIVSELQDQPDAVVIVSGTTIIANSIDIANDTWATEVTAQNIESLLSNIDSDIDIPLSTLDSKLDDVINNLQSLDIGGIVVASGVNSQLESIIGDLQNIQGNIDTPLSSIINELQNLEVGGTVAVSGTVSVDNPFALDSTLLTAITRLEEIRDELINQPDAVVVVSGIESVEVSNFPVDLATDSSLQTIITELGDLQATVSGTVSVDNLDTIESRLDSVINELQSLEISGTATISGIVDANVLNEFATENTAQAILTELENLDVMVSGSIDVGNINVVTDKLDEVITELQNVEIAGEVSISGILDANVINDFALESTAQNQLTELQNIVSELQDQPDAVVIVSGTTIIANSLTIDNDTWATEVTAQSIDSTLSSIDGTLDTPLSTLENSLDAIETAILNQETTISLSGTLNVDNVTVNNDFALDATVQTAVTRLEEIRDELVNQPDSVVVVSGIESVEVSNLGTIESRLETVINELQSLEISGITTISGIVDANVLNDFALDSSLQTAISVLEDVRTAVESQAEATVSGTVAISNDNWATEVTAQAILNELVNQPDAVVIVSGSNIQIDSVTVDNDTWATELTLQDTNTKLDDLINEINANSVVTISGAVTISNEFATEATQINVLEAVENLTNATLSGTSGGSIAAIAVDEVTYSPGFTEGSSAELAVDKDNGRLLTSELKHRIETGTLNVTSTSTTFVNSNPIDLELYDRVSILPNVTVAGGTNGDYSVEWSFDLVNWFIETIDSFTAPSGGESVVEQPVMIRRFDSSSTGLKNLTPVTLDKRARYIRIRQRSDSSVTLTTIYNYQLLELN